MRVEHLEQLRPVCPVCWTTRHVLHRLTLGHIAKQEGEEIVEGVLLCPFRQCQREHPIIDGIPILVVNPASWAETQLDIVLRRDDLSPFLESLLGDIAGHRSNFDRDRGNNGIYADAHWSTPSTFQPLLDAAFTLLSQPPQGHWLDLGCSVGRGTFEIARKTGQLVAGVDLSFSMLRIAERIRRHGRLRYARRRVGLAYDTIDEPVEAVPANVSFWCADAAILPFAPATFDGALAINTLECVGSPAGMLAELGRVLSPNAEAILSTPFDWEVGACPPALWIGGHSQRAPHEGSSLTELRRILSRDAASGFHTGLHIEAERDHVTWRLRNHERSTTEYDVYFARLRKS